MRVELNWPRALGIITAIACLALIPIVPDGAIIGFGLITAVLLYDIVSSYGQRKNFIEDAEKRGMAEYAKRLRNRKI